MPLSALVDGELVTSALLDAVQWQALVEASRAKRVVLSMQCGMPGITRTSKLGTPHFVHSRGSGDGCSKGETPQHRLAKSIIVQAAAAAGWHASTESHLDGHLGPSVADVLAERAGVRVVFEVQLSRQSLAEYTRRHLRYRASGIGSVAWFAKSVNGLPLRSKALPVFPLKITDEDGARVHIGGHKLELADAVTRLLTKGLQHRPAYCSPASVSTIAVAEMRCHACSRTSMVWRWRGATIFGRCGGGGSFRRPASHYLWARPEERSDVAGRARRRAEELGLRPAKLGHRDGPRRIGKHLAFVCAHCRTTFDDPAVEATIANDLLEPIEQKLTVAMPFEHWCVAGPDGCCDLTSTAPE